MTFITRRHRSIKAFVKASLICFVIYKFFPSNIIFETFEIRQIVMNEFYIYFLIKKKKRILFTTKLLNMNRAFYVKHFPSIEKNYKTFGKEKELKIQIY